MQDALLPENFIPFNLVCMGKNNIFYWLPFTDGVLKDNLFVSLNCVLASNFVFLNIYK